ncbi:MAG: acetate kinase [Clostridia bacterium]|nr:acetate kinase [Clostridia bacterium]
MKILVINCGSSTIKFQLIEMEKNEVIAKGRCDKVGYESSNIIYKNLRDSKGLDEVPISMPNHKEAMKVLLDTLQDKDIGVIQDLSEVYAVGHRVVHGGEKFTDATLITNKTLKEIEQISPLAPLHNPGAVMGMQAIMEVAPSLKNVAVFDTAFHQTMPDFNYIYAIDYKYYEKYKIRRYGFHGTSYMYILSRLEELLNKPKDKINAIVCHMGGGASICAIKDGKSYDTSMGFTPLEGLVMETRSGDLDPAIVTKLMREENLSVDEVDEVLNKKSGRQGLCGIGDFRMMKEAAIEGNEKAILARNIQCNRTKKYIGAYMAELNRVDAIVFTGGVAENNACERRRCVEDMDRLGIVIDDIRNEKANGKESLISTDDSVINVYMIPTNEELEIAKQTVAVVEKC